MKNAILFLVATALLVGCPVDPGPAPEPDEVHWLRFVQITDVHIVDEESPARMVRMDKYVGPSWRPQEAYTPQTLDATLQSINGLHAGSSREGYPIDFVVATGDLTDNAQFNELRWFIDTMDGKWIVPDSGEEDGVLREIALEDNPNLGFQAVGLSGDIPWYTVMGNHDQYALGTFPIDRDARDNADWNSPQFSVLALLIGLHDIDPMLRELIPTFDMSPAVITASEELIDPITAQLLLDQLETGPIVPDPARHFISREIFVEEHFNSSSEPLGHGFSDRNRRKGTAFYSVRPDDDIPVRIIVIDTVAPDPILGFPFPYGVMTREQFEDHLKPEVEAAQEAGEFVIIASHHPSSDFSIPHYVDKVTALSFRKYLARQPNIIGHVCGHTHNNKLTIIDGKYPYPEIETSSLIDLPQEMRVLDVFYDKANKTIRLDSSLTSHTQNPTRLSAESHRRATLDAEYAPGFIKGGGEGVEELASLLPTPPELAGSDYAVAVAEQLTDSNTPDEKRGQESDRNFSIVLDRAGFVVSY